uniref:Uncharacterized protein n=1 Tax=Leptobrachium leishanense TaxID=445787 RepID=A0A8C5PWX7_9ANUR
MFLQFDRLAVLGTLRSLLQHHSSEASILWLSAFLMVQLSQPFITTGKTIALTIRTFVGRVMSLLFSMLSRFDIAFLPSSNRLFITWLQSPSAVILEPRKTLSQKPCKYEIAKEPTEGNASQRVIGIMHDSDTHPS